MRLIDADKLYPDRMTTKGGVAISQSQIANAPTVEPERETGEWEYVQYDGNPKIGNWHCSKCRLIVNSGFEGAPDYHYCPNCGSKMEVTPFKPF